MTARAQTRFIVVGELRIERSHPLLRRVVGNEHDVVLAPRRENDEIRAEARRFGFERHDRSAVDLSAVRRPNLRLWIPSARDLLAVSEPDLT
jgi:hypothetical protein